MTITLDDTECDTENDLDLLDCFVSLFFSVVKPSKTSKMLLPYNGYIDVVVYATATVVLICWYYHIALELIQARAL